MKFPFITRSHHAAVTAILQQQLAACEFERQKLLDRIMIMSTGRPIHEVPPEQARQEEQMFELTPEQQKRSLMQRAREAVGNNPRKMAEWMSQVKEQEYQARQHQGLSVVIPLDDDPEAAQKLEMRDRLDAAANARAARMAPASIDDPAKAARLKEVMAKIDSAAGTTGETA